jgi:alpha-N-arabinofuranosidase
LIQTNKEQMVLTPVYHVFDMYQPFKGAKPYPVTISGNRQIRGPVSMVDASAAKASDGKLYLALVNLDPSDTAEVTTNLTGSAEGKVLTGPALDAYNWFDQPAKITPARFEGSFERDGKLALRLPAKSVVVVSIH